MPNPAGLIDRYHDWSKEMISIYKDILPGNDYGYLYDPNWVSAYPYRVDLSQEPSRKVDITIRNFRSSPQHHKIHLVLPEGITTESPTLSGLIAPESTRIYTVSLKRTKKFSVEQGLQIIPFDITLDGHHHGQLFDFLIRTNAADLKSNKK